MLQQQKYIRLNYQITSNIKNDNSSPHEQQDLKFDHSNHKISKICSPLKLWLTVTNKRVRLKSYPTRIRSAVMLCI